jgi:hypothetical protein
MVEAASTSETSVNFYHTTWHNIPENNHLHDLPWPKNMHNMLSESLYCLTNQWSKCDLGPAVLQYFIVTCKRECGPTGLIHNKQQWCDLVVQSLSSTLGSAYSQIWTQQIPAMYRTTRFGGQQTCFIFWRSPVWTSGSKTTQMLGRYIKSHCHFLPHASQYIMRILRAIRHYITHAVDKVKKLPLWLNTVP